VPVLGPMGTHLGRGIGREAITGLAGNVRDALGASRVYDVPAPLVVEPELLRQHALILGSSGTGKTNALAGLMAGLGEFGL
jgi:DNA helicase HerA-like ATPase